MSKKELGKEEVAEDVSLEKTEEIEPVQQVKVQKKLPTRVWVTYILMFIAIIGIVTFAVAFMMGYRLSLTGEIERTGLIQVASSPSGANIVVNGNQMGVRTRARFSLSEGEHWIEVRRDGFDTWQGHYTVKMNDILWLDYVLLFPLRMRPVADATFELTPIQTLNSNRLLAKDADEVLYSVDFSGGNNYRVQRLNFTMESLQELIDITVARNGEATEEGGAEEKDEIKLERIVATHNDNNFWVQGSNNTVFLYTANSRRLTLIGVTNRVMMEAEFNYRDLVFVAQNTQNNRYEVFFYQIGDATPTYWRAFDEKPKMAMASYDNVNYLALEFGEQTIIYYSSRGRFFENAERLTTIEDTGNLSFSPSGRFLRVGDKNYDIENDVFYEEISANHWFNGHIMSFMREDKFFVKDFDGQNEREVAIEPVSLDYVFISDNNRRLYYFDVENRLIFVDLQGVE